MRTPDIRSVIAPHVFRIAERALTFLRLGVSVPVLILLLVGCGDEEVAVKDPVVRAIKSYEIAEPATGDKRDYSGTLVASNTSALGFAVSGTVRTVDVSAGDNVLKGQVLASLDTEPFELSVSAARAQLADAEATFTEMQAAGRAATPGSFQKAGSPRPLSIRRHQHSTARALNWTSPVPNSGSPNAI